MADQSKKPLDVLLVEDSPTQAQLVQLIASEVDDFNLIHHAEDGDEALVYLREDGAKRPDLVLLDINMPKMDGFEVLKEMKADKDLCKIPVVMLTTSSAEEDIVKSYQDGASTFMSKPLELQKLKEILEQFAAYWSQAAKLPNADS